jgi:competence protein ComEC
MASGRPAGLVVFGIVVVVALALVHQDEIHGRAADALGRGMPTREAELARGFVLGEDDAIDDATIEDFRRAGLSHLLAVSGQNVALLALLAIPLLAALGIPLRARLVWILGAIVVYVPLAGAGPSILRAGVMGAITVLATLAGRRSSRLYALALAAVVTLAIEPRIGADVGWQLSFAAVLGILLLASPLRTAIGSWIGARGWRGALAEGAAVTIAATLATAPLIALHFGTVSTTTLIANLLALPAVAPAMWLGMLAAAAGQVPGFPVVVLNEVNALLLAYIAQIAAWCGRPSWAYLHLELGATGLIVAYLALGAATVGAPRLLRRHRIANLKRRQAPIGNGLTSASVGLAPSRRQTLRRAAAAAGVGLVALVLVWAGSGGGAGASSPVAGLRVTVLDVGQGDAVLLQAAAAPAILIDGGPPGGGLAAMLRTAGVQRLGVAVVTHEQSDHAGGIGDLLGRFQVGQLAYSRLSRRLRGEAEEAGAVPVRISAGDALRAGRLQIEVLWPPPELLVDPLAGADPNTQALVLLARWRGFSMLLSADAEAEAVPLDPGPLDVLKLAHHGSDDAGLDALLGRTSPELAVISVGADNPYGHPTPATLTALAAHDVRALRTDRDGTIVIDVGPRTVAVSSGG